MAATGERASVALWDPVTAIERATVVEALRGLARQGFSLHQHRFLGIWSLGFADFIAVHEQLNVADMIALGCAPSPRSAHFNAPYDFVRLDERDLAAALPDLDRSVPHVAWLRYPYELDGAIVDEVVDLSRVLSPGSVIVVTARAQMPPLDFEFQDADCRSALRDAFVANLRGRLGQYHAGPIGAAHCTADGHANLVGTVLASSLARAQLTMPGAQRRFHLVLNQRVRGTLASVTVGGIVLLQSDPRAADLSVLTGQLAISPPNLTSRERWWLDTNPGASIAKRRSQFELTDADADAYRRSAAVYRAIPEPA